MLLEKLVIIAIIIAIKSLKEYRKNYCVMFFCIYEKCFIKVRIFPRINISPVALKPSPMIK